MKYILGRVDKKVIEEFNVPTKFLNRKIVLHSNDKKHCEKRHLKDFKNKNHFYYVMSNLDYIFENPSIVFFDEEKQTIEYYAEFGMNISVRVRVDLGYELKIKTMFPVEDDKIEDRKQKLVNEKYMKKQVA